MSAATTVQQLHHSIMHISYYATWTPLLAPLHSQKLLSQNTRREPTQARGEHTNSIQKVSSGNCWPKAQYHRVIANQKPLQAPTSSGHCWPKAFAGSNISSLLTSNHCWLHAHHLLHLFLAYWLNSDCLLHNCFWPLLATCSPSLTSAFVIADLLPLWVKRFSSLASVLI